MAAFGFLLLIAGLLGAGVLYVLSTQRPDKAVDGFARASAGCTTTLDFTETGTFLVYQETGSTADTADEGCAPTPTPGERFSFELTGPAAVTPVADLTVTYDSEAVTGASVARFEIATAGLYEIAVRSEDVAIVAAVGRDPDSGVEQQQRNALDRGCCRWPARPAAAGARRLAFEEGDCTRHPRGPGLGHPSRRGAVAVATRSARGGAPTDQPAAARSARRGSTAAPAAPGARPGRRRAPVAVGSPDRCAAGVVGGAGASAPGAHAPADPGAPGFGGGGVGPVASDTPAASAPPPPSPPR